MEFNYKLITSKDELLLYKEDIFKLFLHSFDKAMDNDIWEWMYIGNPIGDPIVSLCFDGDLLVGHYAAIQLPINAKEEKKKAILSVGSMVHSSYRKYGVFVKQGEKVYAYAKDSFYCVIGFPNKMALPSRKKRLLWTINENDFVALVTKEQLVSCSEFNNHLKIKKDIELDTSSIFLEWRLSKPKSNYQKKGSIITKRFEDNLDVVYLTETYADDLEDDTKYHVLCDGTIDTLKQYKVFDYPFGYRMFTNTSESISFKKDLLMSDVF